MCALRAKKPEEVAKRLKLFMFSPAGVGKTTAAIQFPNAYIIDAEKGTENYAEKVNKGGSVVFQTNDIGEVIQEVRALLTEKHDFRTLVIDPITTLYDDLLEKCEKKVGSEFGRHYGEANKAMKRLANLILALDMNVIVTAHAKKRYGKDMAELGVTFDGWKQLDYWFDLVLELRRQGPKRVAFVVKTRIESFPDESVFEWSYAEFTRRYNPAILAKQADAMALASPEQVAELSALLNIVKLPEGTVDKWLSKANVDDIADLPAAIIAKCIEHVKKQIPAAA